VITNASLYPRYSPKQQPNNTKMKLSQKPISKGVINAIVVSKKGNIIRIEHAPRMIPIMIGPNLTEFLKSLPIATAVEMLKIIDKINAKIFIGVTVESYSLRLANTYISAVNVKI
jgi:hypothetical protein